MTKTPKSWLDGPKIWPSWGGAPEGEGELQCGGGPTDADLAELAKALRGYDSLYGPGEQWLPDQQGRVNIPFRLFIMLSNLVDRNIRQLAWTQEKKDWLRAAYVEQERADGKTVKEAVAADRQATQRRRDRERHQNYALAGGGWRGDGEKVLPKSHALAGRGAASAKNPQTQVVASSLINRTKGNGGAFHYLFSFWR
jgi:hypothetical protein